MFRIFAVLVALQLGAISAALAQAGSNDKTNMEHGSGGHGWSGDLGGARNASKNEPKEVNKFYVAPVATGLDLKGPPKTEGPFAE